MGEGRAGGREELGFLISLCFLWDPQGLLNPSGCPLPQVAATVVLALTGDPQLHPGSITTAMVLWVPWPLGGPYVVSLWGSTWLHSSTTFPQTHPTMYYTWSLLSVATLHPAPTGSEDTFLLSTVELLVSQE